MRVIKWIQGRRGREAPRGGAEEEDYLSFSQEDVGNDVRKTAAQHQHHAFLAVGYTRNLETEGYF